MRLGYLLLVGAIVWMAGGVAAQEQPTTATVDASVEERPGSLPGEYEANVTVTVRVAGDQCTCRQTQVTLVSSAERADGVSFDPASYTIDWTQRAIEGESGPHVQHAGATVSVPAVDEGPIAVTVDAEMEHEPDAATTSNSEPDTLELELPRADGSDAAPTAADEGGGSNAEANETGGDGAEIDTKGEDSGDGGRDGVPGPAAGLTALAVTGAAIGRKRR